MGTPNYSTYDAALDQLAPYGTELKNGNFNHAPMVAEALCALGYPEATIPWIERYCERMQPRPAAGEPIRTEDWRGALGRRERFTDWALFFANELADTAWPIVLDRWVKRLAPGFCAAATHGVIRLGHAARGMAAGETASRRRETADALASWAATWQRLPESNARPAKTLSPRQAIVRMPIVPPAQRLSGNITAALAVLDGFPEFAPVIGWIDTDGPIGPQIAELTELFARVYLTNARDIPTAIAFIHAVTAPAALGNIVPHIREETARAALRYAWQAACALYACYGSAPAFAGQVEPSETNKECLIDRAIANGDEHVIKLTEACLNRNAVAASAAYLAAVDHVAGMIRRQRLR
jgi:Questin oxidase-like